MSKEKEKKSTSKKTVKKTSAVKKKTGTKAAPKRKAGTKASSKKKTTRKATSLKQVVDNYEKKNRPKQSKKSNTVPLKPEKSEPESDMTVTEHLGELRSRLLLVLFSLILFTVIGFFFSDYLVEFINRPFLESGNKLNVFKLTGGFIIRLKASACFAILISLPLLVFQVWRFIAPAISPEDKTFAKVSMFSSVFLFYLGICFVFFLIIPFAIKVLLGFISTEMISTIGADDYLNFIFLFSIAMGILFELPIIIMVLTKIGIITPYILVSKRKYAIIAIWIIAALVTPQDPLSQVLVAVPLMFLYEISIFISKIIIRRSYKKNKQ